MTLTFQKLDPNAVIPVRATEQSAGLDLSACIAEDIVLQPGETRLIPTGLAAAPDRADVMLLLCARSGLSTKHGITMVNGVGVVDADYRGELRIPLINLSDAAFTVTNGMRIAQLICVPVLYPAIETAETLPDTARGAGGFGSSGT